MDNGNLKSSAKWQFRIVEQEYDNGDKVYILESDKGVADNWQSIYRNSKLSEVRAIKQERETKSFTPAKTKVIE